jgi:hypothetical protein
MDQVRAEHLQPFLQFFDLVLDVFFYGGIFVKPINNVNVHERLGLAVRSSRNQVLSKADCTPGARKANGEFEPQKDIILVRE